MKVEALSRPLSLAAVRDGGIYRLALESFEQTNLFLKVGRIDQLVIKTPSPRGFNDYRKYVRLAQRTSADIRAPEDSERFEALDATLLQLPAFRHLANIDREILHYLIVHKIQYERLRQQALENIPAACFALIRSGLLIRRLQPVFFQEHMDGTTLWDMFDFSLLKVTSQWRPFLPAISPQLTKLLDSPLGAHMDWNIKNFVFRATDERLFYVDLKPTLFVAAHGNEHNLNGIRDYFIQ